MAENENGEEKTEEPSGRRLQQARKKGQLPRSRELNTVMVMLASGVALYAFGDDIMAALADISKTSFLIERSVAFDPQYMLIYLQNGILHGLISVAPLGMVALVVGVFSSIVLSGWNFSVEALAFKASKMNPIKGLKKIIGVKGLIELVKALAKVILIGSFSVLMFYIYLQDVLHVGVEAMEPAIAKIGHIFIWFFIVMSASLIAVAAIDVPFQIFDHRKNLKMTKDEVKQEHKQQEGSPETKSRIRNLQRQAAQRRMMQEVPKADVIITNPTHYSVAIKYDQKRSGAPIVVAKGVDVIALKIREIAKEHKVPILASPALARAIYYNTELNDEIPEGLYKAVAKVLAYIFQLRRRPGTDFSKPISFEDVPIPNDFKRDG